MSILAPSRGELLPVHDPFFGPLQPSAMPAPQPTASPNTVATAPFPLPTSFEMARLEHTTLELDTHERTLAWQKSLEVGGKSATPRVALSNVNTNTASTTAQTLDTKKVTSRPSNSFSTSHSIPKPAAVPDVFAASESDKSHKHPAKRNRGDPLPSLASKRARVDREAHEAAKRDYKVEEQAWRAKWLKMFPTLLFHFEMGTQQGSGKQLVQRVIKMGAKVDQFFSTRITHLIVKNAGSPQKPKAMGPPSRKLNVTRDSPMSNPFLDGTGTTDLAQKAQKLGIKVWTVDKLANMLSRLAPVETVVNDSLRTLLEDERIHGTRERDLSAPRPDWYYFKPGSKYLLIEDATGKHRPVMMKEYAYQQKDKDSPDWPTLYEKFLRPSSASQSSFPIDKIRERAWTLYVEQKPYKGERPPLSDMQESGDQCSPEPPKLPEALPYQNASGNSVVLTSNVASTSTARDSPAAFGSNGVFKDRAMMNMNKRVQVLKGNARNMAAKRSIDTPERSSRQAEPKPTTAAFPHKAFLPQPQLCLMLQQAREPNRDPPPTYEARVKNREKVDAGLKGREQDTASGYCENCRLRYSDLSVHIASRKHRRFATNPENFASLDRLLQLLVRAPNPKLATPDYPVCNEEHGVDETCQMCEIWQNESGSETQSPCSGSSSQTQSQSLSESEADVTENFEEDSEQDQEPMGQEEALEQEEHVFEEIYDEEGLY